MKKNLLICLSAALFVFQGCTKNNSTTTKPATAAIPLHYAPEGESLKVNGAADHGTFQLISVSTGKSSEIANLSLANGGTSDLATFTGIGHQIWRIWDAGNGYFKIMNDGSGKYMQSYLYGGVQQLIQVFSDTTSAQLWSITSTGNGYYKCINKSTGLAITSPSATGAAVTLTPYTNNNTQWWSYNQFADQAYRDDYVVNFFHRQHGSISFDQGNSIPLSSGAVVWVTEDTYTQNDDIQPNGQFPCGRFFDIHNSLLLQPANHSWDEKQTNNIVTHNSIYPYEALASPGNHNATETWPGVGVEVGNHVYMYAYEGPPQNGFNDVVIYDFTEGANGSLDWGTGVRHAVPGVSDQDSITYAEGFVKPGDGYVYAYGSINVFLDKFLYVARFAEDSPFVWTFWDGKGWAAKPTTATVAQVKFTGGSDNAVQANTTGAYVNGKWVMMQMDLGYFCDNNPHNIYMSVGSSPVGPFTAKKQVFTIEDMINGHLCNYYTPSIHPEFVNGENELLVTYCLNYTTCDVSTCPDGFLDPNFYQVKGVRIPFAEIGL